MKELRDLERVARRVEKATADLATARRAQRGAIRAAHAAGASYTAIGNVVGISRQRVKQLIDVDP